MEVVSTLRDRNGNVYLKSAVVLLIAAIVVSVGMSIYHVYHTLGAVREKVNEAVLAVAAANVSEFYGGSRESDGYARHPAGNGGFAASCSTGDILAALAYSTNGAVAGATIQTDSYAITISGVDCVNQLGRNLRFVTTIQVVVPLDIGGISIPIEKAMEVKSQYDTRF